MKKIIYIVLAIISLSCETIVSDLDPNKFPELKSKIVIAAFLSPQDENIIVRVSKSVPLFDSLRKEVTKIYDENLKDSITVSTEVQYIKDAKVTIIYDKFEYVLDFDKEKNYHTAPANFFPIKEGYTYTIKVEALNQTATATTTIPKFIPEIENLKITPFTDIHNDFNRVDSLDGFEVDFDWKDEAKVNNYYKISGELESYEEAPKIIEGKTIYSLRKTYNYLRTNDNDFTGGNRYLSDNLQDGKLMKARNAKVSRRKITVCGPNKCESSKIAPSSAQTFTLELWNTSKELYDYQISLQKFNQTANNPFAEPTPVYSNIKNGLGIFASYNRTLVKKTL